MQNQKDTIVFVIKDIKNSAGTEKATIGIANALSERGYQVYIAILEKTGEPFFELSPSVKTFVVSIKEKTKGLKFKDWERRKTLRRFYQTILPKLIIFVGSGRSLLNIPTARGFRHVTWEHFNSEINWHLLHPLSKWLAAKFCEKIITLTDEDAIDYRKKYGAKTICIPNFIDVPDERSSDLQQKTMISVGRLTPQKGFDLLLESWSKTKCLSNGWKLKIVGEGKMQLQLQNQIKKLGIEDSVEILPNTPKVWEELINASVYLMGSRYEGLPLILLEALSAGLPLIAFDCKTGPREVIVSGENGFIIPKFEVESMSNSIDQIAFDKDLRMRMGKNSLNRKHLFSQNTIVEKWISLINEKN
jgi:glycosyltransferase involved in cell wall biosynthesis